MNNKILASLVILVPLMFGQVALADNEPLAAQYPNQQLSQELKRSDLSNLMQDYSLEKFEPTQARRSTLFANVLDSLAKNATLAKTGRFTLMGETQTKVL